MLMVWVKNLTDSIVLLQETHCTKLLEKNGKMNDKGKYTSQTTQVAVGE